MSEKKELWIKAGLAVLVIAAVIAMVRRHRMTDAQIIAAQPSAPDFTSPFYQTNPGIYDNSVNGNGPSFNAQNTININTGAISGLSNSYMPMFGLVGMTAIGA